MRDNPPPHLRHTAWSGILQRFFALALVYFCHVFYAFNVFFILRTFFIYFFLSNSAHVDLQDRAL